MKKIIISLLFVSIVAIGSYEILKTIFLKKEIIELKVLLKNNSYEKVFFKTYLGEPIITISNNEKLSDMSENMNDNIIFDDGDAIFYKTYTDTLEIVYLAGVKRNKSLLKFEFHIKEIAVNNVKFMDLYSNYIKMGYRRFPNK